MRSRPSRTSRISVFDEAGVTLTSSFIQSRSIVQQSFFTAMHPLPQASVAQGRHNGNNEGKLSPLCFCDTIVVVKHVGAAVFLFFAGGLLFAQSAGEMDNLLSAQAVSWADACRWVYTAAGIFPFETDSSEVILYALIEKHIPQDAGLDDNQYIDLKGLSKLILESYRLRGGIMYRLFRTRRYAYRELMYRGLLRYDDDPADRVSGQRLFQILKAMEHVSPDD
jgi:hypothetical protein